MRCFIFEIQPIHYDPDTMITSSGNQETLDNATFEVDV